MTRGRPKGTPRAIPAPDYVPAYGAAWHLPRDVRAELEAECDRVDELLGYGAPMRDRAE